MSLVRARRRSGHKQAAPFSAGRRKPPVDKSSQRTAAAPHEGKGSERITGAVTDRRQSPTFRATAETGKAAGKGWKALKRRLVLGSAMARLAAPSHTNANRELVHKKAGSAVGSSAKTERWDVQNVYRSLFFPADHQQAAEIDPWSQAQGAGQASASLPAYDRVDSIRARNRLHALSTLKRKFKRTLVSLVDGAFQADWSALFHHYDTDGSNGIGLAELKACVRIDANVSEDQLSDEELEQLFM